MEYENIKNIELIVENLKLHGIKNLVISPGGTNIPLVKQVQDDEFFSCYSVVDERSAAYFAIGLYLQKREPIALICTSAQATRNYVPGLTEAFYKRVPLLAITMEKHPRFKYQNYMQAPDQTSLPDDSVKKSFELPFIRDINDIYHSRRVINDAMLELTHNGFGPVQLCVPWLDFKISDIEPSNLGVRRYQISDVDKISFQDKKVLLLIGEHTVFSEKEKQAISHFCQNVNCAIYTNHLSNFSNEFSVNGNLLLSVITDEAFKAIQPDILISIGYQTGDYPFYLRFSKTDYPEMEHWLVSVDGEIMDTYDKLARVYQGNEEEFFSKVEAAEVEHSYLESWKNLTGKLQTGASVPFSNTAIAQYLHGKIPKNSIMQFSILNSLRVWNLFDLNPSLECYSNVGAFGIDGGMSTLIGQSVANPDKLAFLIIGDLAFFYDMNSLGIRHIGNNLRIILVNNNGGVEFKLHGEQREMVNNYIAAADHFKNAKGWAETCGFKYLSAKNSREFEKNSKEFLGGSKQPILLEVFVDDHDESVAYHAILDSNREFSMGDRIVRKMKGSIKKRLGI